MGRQKKALGKDKFGVQKVMRVKDYFGDALGQFSLNIIANVIGQITYFYTDKVGMAAGSVATILLISKILDAFTDLIMGNIVDHTKPGREKYRPWLMKAGIPASIMLILIFTVPNVGDGAKLVYVLITNILLTAICYTAVAIPFTSLMAVRTNSQEERGIMGTWRAGAGYVSGAAIAMMVIPVTNMLGGNQSAWIKLGIILGLAALLGFIICYAISKETATEDGNQQIETSVEAEEIVPFKEAIVKLFHNKYWVIVLIVNLMSCILYGILAPAGTYYCKWIFGNDNLVGILGAVGMIPTLVGFAAVGPMIKKLGVIGTLKVSFAVGIIANALMIILHNNFMAYMIVGCFSTFATIPMMCLVGVMTTMAIDYNEYKYGVKMIACSSSASSFGGKVGGGIGGSLIGWMLAFVGYNPALEAAPAATKMAIYGFSFIIPLIMFILMFILVSRFDLEKKLPAMREEIVRRKAVQEK